jgi:hypothetical protein
MAGQFCMRRLTCVPACPVYTGRADVPHSNDTEGANVVVHGKGVLLAPRALFYFTEASRVRQLAIWLVTGKVCVPAPVRCEVWRVAQCDGVVWGSAFATGVELQLQQLQQL